MCPNLPAHLNQENYTRSYKVHKKKDTNNRQVKHFMNVLDGKGVKVICTGVKDQTRWFSK